MNNTTIHKKKKSLLILFQEKILIDSFLKSSWVFFIFILFLGYLMIFSSYSLNYKIFKITSLKQETYELRTESAKINAELIKCELESEYINDLIKDSFTVLKKNPFKIVIKKKYDN